MLKRTIALLAAASLMLGAGALFAVAASAGSIPSYRDWHYLSDDELYAYLSGDITLGETYAGISQDDDMLLRFVAPASGWYNLKETVENPEEYLWFALYTRNGVKTEPPSPYYPYISWTPENYTVWLEGGTVYLLMCSVWADYSSYIRIGTGFTVTVSPVKFTLGYDTIKMYFDQELNIPTKEIVKENTYPYITVNLSDPLKSYESPFLFDTDFFQDRASQAFYIATSPYYRNCLRILNKGITPKDRGSIIFYDPRGTEIGRIQLEVSLSAKQWFFYYILFGWIYMRTNNWAFLI